MTQRGRMSLIRETAAYGCAEAAESGTIPHPFQERRPGQSHLTRVPRQSRPLNRRGWPVEFPTSSPNDSPCANGALAGAFSVTSTPDAAVTLG
jgi:hypothetical protein